MKALAEALQEGKNFSWRSEEPLPSLYSLCVQPRPGLLDRINKGTTTVVHSASRSLLVLTLSGGHLNKRIDELALEVARCALDDAEDHRVAPYSYAERLFAWLLEQSGEGKLLYRCLSDVLAGMLIDKRRIWLLRVGANCVYSAQSDGFRLVSEDTRHVVLEERGEWPRAPYDNAMTRVLDNTLSPLCLGAEKGYQSILLPLAPLMLLGRGLIPIHPLPTRLSSIDELAALDAGWRHGLTGVGALVAFSREPGAPLEATRLAWGE